MKTSWFKTMAAACAVSLVSLGAFGAEEITMTTSNHYPWDGKVDCVTELSGLTSGETYYGVFELQPTLFSWPVVITNEDLTADGIYTNTFDCTTLFGTELCTTGAGITVKLYKKDKPREGVQLWEGGPYFATTNIGAENPTDYGYYFWWGDTVGYTNNMAAVAADKKWVSSKDGKTTIKFDDKNPTSGQTYGKTLDQLQDAKFIDSTSNPKLNDAHDAAHVHWGSTWRMMTDEELQNLLKNCSSTFVANYKKTGVAGRIVTGKAEGYTGKEIFLPAAGQGIDVKRDNAGSIGYYRTSAPDTGNPNWAPYLYSGTTSTGWSRKSDQYNTRYYGSSIRPVSSTKPVAGPDTEVTSASGTFEVDTRTTKTTTLAGAKIVGGETSIILKYSPTAWGAISAGASVIVTYKVGSVEGSILQETWEEGTVNWTPPAVAGTYELKHRVFGEDGMLAGELTNDFEVVVNPTVEVKPVAGTGTTVSGVYTNGIEVVAGSTPGSYTVVSNAVVDVAYYAVAEAGYFFKNDTGYTSFATNTVTASDIQTIVVNPDPVQGTSCGDTAYFFLDETGKMTMVGSGEATGFPAEFDRNSVTNVVIGEGITGIGEDFFKGCESLTRVTGGKDLEDVGAEAFYSCPVLEAITLDAAPDGMGAAVYMRTSFTSGGQWLEIPVVTMPGYKQVVYGKQALTDTEWTDLGSPEGKGLYDYEGYYFFKIDLISEE